MHVFLQPFTSQSFVYNTVQQHYNPCVGMIIMGCTTYSKSTSARTIIINDNVVKIIYVYQNYIKITKVSNESVIRQL